jgi:hypothetical protein
VIDANMFDQKRRGRNRGAVASPKDELAHFELCPMCSQAVDRRDIYAVMHHLPVGHAPLPVH